MAGHRTEINGMTCFIDYPDGYGEAEVNGKTWRWEFHRYCGPTFLKKDGEPRKCQFPKNKKVWVAFEKWHREYESSKVKSSWSQ